MELTSEHKCFIESLDSRLAYEALNADDAAEICEHEFLRDPERIIALNNEMRQLKARWTTDDLEPRPWPDDYLIIGDSGCGDYYCVSRTRAFPGIVAYEHEMAAFTPFAASFDEYYELMMQDFRKRIDRY